MYSKKVIEYFENPVNVGKIENPDGVGRAGNPECGDTIELYIKVVDDRITDIKFKTFGCAAAVASSSMLTELVLGKKLDEALSVTKNDVADNLGGLPERKMHCSNMAEDALRLAIEDYRNNHGSKKAAD
ncbi:MAG: iron-sulfur cluster assembly scaffold protein [Deltaproteobacteria bacterium]|uniref:Iron-sulfur cluster assembly scaffold protein n=1 Tax=Candidatus Zymogenus saltonus TaxID=2844893 RepID=A0A9D8KGM7_9DELT|nr:iron-sulfur cluster assembly scaffold protein [Candidatus Zymogenus saltonus]